MCFLLIFYLKFLHMLYIFLIFALRQHVKVVGRYIQQSSYTLDSSRIESVGTREEGMRWERGPDRCCWLSG